MGIPLEVVATPFELWLAPVGESFPLIDATPAGNWVKIGTSGHRSTTEDGVTVTHSKNIEEIRSLGSTGPIKGFITEEGLVISLTIMDITLENYNLAFNHNTVTDTAASSGVAGIREMDLYMGPVVDLAQRALLVRGLNASPYLASSNIQYQIPVVYESGSPEVVSQKGTPIGLALEFTAIEDPNASTDADRFGKLVMMDEAQGA